MPIKIKKHNLDDRSFRSSIILYTKEMMKNYGIPGKLIKKCFMKLTKKNNSELEPDCILYVKLATKKHQKNIIYIIEHQSYITDEKKIKIIKDYLDLIKCKTQRPVHVYIITSIDPKKHQRRYEKTLSDIIEPEYIYISYDDIQQMLNNINNKIKNHEKISDTQALQLIIALIFAPRNKKDEVFDEVFDILKREKTIEGDIREYIVDILEKYNGETFNEKTRMELENMSAQDMETRRRAMRALYEDELNEEVNIRVKEELNKKTEELNKKTEELNEKTDKLNKKINTYKNKIKELTQLTDLNSPQAKEILNTLVLL